MRSSILVVTALCCTALAGCGGDARLQTRGRVVKGGVPFTVPVDDFVRVIFLPQPEGGEPKTSYAGEFNNTEGTFKAIGPDLRGIPPGRYRVALAHERKKRDLFKGVYDLEKSPFVFTIDANTPEIVLDLDKPNG